MDGLFSPASPLGAIVLALIAAAVAALFSAHSRRVVWPLKRRVLPLARRIALKAPRPIQPFLRVSADNVIPFWRANAGGSHRNRVGTRDRINFVRTVKNVKIVLAGSIYLDISLSPVSTGRLEETEFGDLDSVRQDCGGSALHVGRFLWSKFHRKSYLVSRVGRGDAFSADLRRRLDRESWIKRKDITSAAGAQCGVSVHLIQHTRAFHTTFTHKGALSSFSWNNALAPILRTLRRGGVLYISGYFRTGLYEDLRMALRALSPDVLVVVDHGRFRPDEARRAIEALADAFAGGLVDVYLCTYSEFVDFMRSQGEQPLKPSDAAETARQFALTGRLPSLTVVRGEPAVDQAVAHVIVEGELHIVATPCENAELSTGPGSKSAFNAGFIHALLTGPADAPIDEAAVGAARSALRCWVTSS